MQPVEYPIQWQVAYSVGIRVIDEQHQHLIEIINTLAAKLETSVGPIDLEEYFQELVSYGDYHFQTEETFFGQYDYPERTAHLAAHAAYRETVRNFMLRGGDSHGTARELLDFLEKWWVEHITGMDQTLRTLSETSST
jgi:hemerythrin